MTIKQQYVELSGISCCIFEDGYEKDKRYLSTEVTNKFFNLDEVHDLYQWFLFIGKRVVTIFNSPDHKQHELSVELLALFLSVRPLGCVHTDRDR